MHLLYLDESGCITDSRQRYFVLAGVSVFERQTHWIEQSLNSIAARFNPTDPHLIELHGSPMRSGRDGWKKHAPYADRMQAIKDALSVVPASTSRGTRLFAAVIRKAAVPGIDPVEDAFTQMAMRFDHFLRRQYLKHHDPQRGVIIFDKSSTEKRIQTLAREFKYTGHKYGTTKNYAEVPLFLDSRASRLTQLADLVAFAIYRFNECGDSTFYDIIKFCFDSEGGVEHGLYVRA